MLVVVGLMGCSETGVNPDKNSPAPDDTEMRLSNALSSVDLPGPKVSLADAGTIASKLSAAGIVGSKMNSANSAGANLLKEEATLLIIDTPEGVAPKPVGTVTMRRNPDNNTINWTLNAEGLGNDGHAYTIWWGNLPFTEAGGYGGGGLINNGEVTASNNHCTWTLETFWDGGFRPGKKPTCDRIDASGTIVVNLLIHDEWEPGDMMERWDPDGDPQTLDPGDPTAAEAGPAAQCNEEDECDSFKEPNRTLIAVFDPIE